MSSSSMSLDDERLHVLPWIVRGLDWLTGYERQVLMAGVLFQLAVLATMIIRPTSTLITGETVLLRVQPVDPRDLFRGDYVILSYDITRPTTDGSAEAANMAWQRLDELRGRTIYVPLEPDADGKHWHAAGYQLDRPADGSFIRGTVMRNGLVHYGIEQFFVQEGQGLEYEQAVRDRKLSAEIAIDRDGKAQIKRLVIE